MAAPNAKKNIDEAIDEFFDTTGIVFNELELSTEDQLLIKESTLRGFSMILQTAFQVESLDHLREVHIGAYYCLRRSYLTVEFEKNQHRISLSAREGVAAYLGLQMELLQRFLSYCWAQGYLSNEYLRWSWRLDDLERNRSIARFSK
jgi:hypothetical protein